MNKLNIKIAMQIVNHMSDFRLNEMTFKYYSSRGELNLKSRWRNFVYEILDYIEREEKRLREEKELEEMWQQGIKTHVYPAKPYTRDYALERRLSQKWEYLNALFNSTRTV